MSGSVDRLCGHVRSSLLASVVLWPSCGQDKIKHHVLKQHVVLKNKAGLVGHNSVTEKKTRQDLRVLTLLQKKMSGLLGHNSVTEG